MNDEEFRLLDRIEDDHWWFVGKRLVLHAIADRFARGGRILDLGCGTGGILSDWATESRCYGVDRSKLAIEICRKRGLESVAQGDLMALPLAPNRFDLVFALDVIEHLDDDRAFLREARQLCAPGGRVIVASPAFQVLWSKHDETFQHRRRYSAAQLESVLREAGLEPERTTFTNVAVFPVAALWRLVSSWTPLRHIAPKTDFWDVPNWLNRLLTTVYRLEARMLARWNAPFGLSVVCVARVPPVISGTEKVSSVGAARAQFRSQSRKGRHQEATEDR